jgi:hypothetical protein
MEDKRYQIFVSSTYEDLKDERMAILNAILDMKHFPAGMEYFPAMDEEQMTFIKRVIDESDYYVLILKARYGSVDKKTGKSYTEQEYDYAIEKGKKVIALIHGNPNKIERDKTDKNERKFKKFISFQEKVKTNRLVKYWDNMTDLVSKFQTSLYETIEQDTKTGINSEMGWVRGDSISSKKMQQEIKTLTQEKQNLEENYKDLLEKNKTLEHGKQQLKETLLNSKNITLDQMLKNSLKDIGEMEKEYQHHKVISKKRINGLVKKCRRLMNSLDESGESRMAYQDLNNLLKDLDELNEQYQTQVNELKEIDELRQQYQIMRDKLEKIDSLKQQYKAQLYELKELDKQRCQYLAKINEHEKLFQELGLKQLRMHRRFFTHFHELLISPRTDMSSESDWTKIIEAPGKKTKDSSEYIIFITNKNDDKKIK